MLAYRIHAFGGPEVFRPESVDIPEPSGSAVLIRVLTAGVNPVDAKTRAGTYPMIGDRDLPYILGRDVAGIVEQVGDLASPWKAGDEVIAFVGQGHGTFAEYVIVDAKAIARRPESVDWAHAGAIPLAALTAWQGLFDHGTLESGQRVLIHGASGGVGLFAIQFARQVGADVFATASGEGVNLLREMGADHAIDYTSEKFEAIATDIDLVLDLVGGETQQRSWGVIKPGGVLVSTLGEPSQEEAAKRDIRAMRFLAEPDGQQLATICTLIDEGDLVVKVVGTYPFDAAPDALAAVEEGHARGKVVIEVAMH
jgi:NADPH:quinone reductase-like Zn-dependent oxidoreductase